MIALAGVSFACADPDRMFAFWTAVLEDEPLLFRTARKTRIIRMQKGQHAS